MSSRTPEPFDSPVYVSRPMLPPLEEYVVLLRGVWERRWLTNNGQLLLDLERRLHRYLEAPFLSVFTNGTLALEVGLRALRISGEVITTPFTFPATPNAICVTGLEPVFVDVDPVTLTIDPDAVERAITPKTSAILGVHVYGMPCHVEALEEIGQRHGLKVIYDGAHAFGTRVGGRPIGSFGDMTMFSFHATKLFHAAEGGALIVRDAEIKRRVDLLRNFGILDEATVVEAGSNSKMSELQAALGLLVLDRVEAERAARARVAEVYGRRIGRIPGLSPFHLPASVEDSRQYWIMRVDEQRAGIGRDALVDGLKRFNIFARRYFYPLVSEAVHLRSFRGADPEGLPVATRVSREVVSLPFFGELGEDGAHRIVDAIEAVCGFR